MNLDELIRIFELFSYIVTVFGLPFAIGTFIFQKRKERKVEEENTFHQLDESYVAFLQLCLQHPDLDIFYPPIGSSYKPTNEQLRREHAVFCILISLFERAYVMFNDKSPEYRGAQWSGWVQYMESYCYRSNFEREWEMVGEQFDVQFYEFMQNLIKKTKESNKESANK